MMDSVREERNSKQDFEEERKAKSREALKRFRVKEKREKEEKARRKEQLLSENPELEHRIAVQRQVNEKTTTYPNPIQF